MTRAHTPGRAGPILAACLVVAGCCGGPPHPVATKRQLVAVPQPVAAQAPADARPAAKLATDADPVALAMTVAPSALRAGDAFEVTLSVDVAPGYEIYPIGAAPPAVPTRIDLDLPAGFRADGEWSRPPTVRSENPDGHSAYAGQVVFVRRVVVARDLPPGVHRLGCAVRYQACTARLCLSPAEFTLAATVTVESN